MELISFDQVRGGDVKVCGMMKLLLDGNFKRKRVLYKTIEDVCSNFTCIHNAATTRLETSFDWLKRKLLVEVVCLMTFCRWSLSRILEGDGMTVNQSLAALLADIELYLLDFINNRTRLNFEDYLKSSKLKDIKERIGKAYNEDLPIHRHKPIISLDIMLQFFDVFGGTDVASFTNNQRMDVKALVFLRQYIEVLAKGQIHCDQKFLIAVDNIAYKIARNYYDAAYKTDNFLDVLKALVSQSESPVMSDEFVKQVLLELLKNDTIPLKDASRCQLWVLNEWISLVKDMLIRYLPSHSSEHDELSNTIRLHFHALLMNVLSVIVSCYENPVIEQMSLGFFDLIQKFHVLKGEIIMAICCTILRATEQESPKKDQLGSLIFLLKNFKEFMDGKPSSIITLNDHENLVLFIFYLVQNNVRGGNCNLHLEVDLSMINHEEVNGVLVSAQVLAFNVATDSLVRRSGRFLWRELYLETYAGMHTRVGILKAIALSSTSPSSHELLMECIQDCLSDLPDFQGIEPLKDQLNILLEWLPFLWRFLTCFLRDEHAKLLYIRADFQELVSSIGIVICSSFKNILNGDTTMQMSTAEHSNLVTEISRITVEAKEFLYLVNIQKIGRESPKTNQLGALNSILENWKELMECESDLAITWKEQFQMIHKNFVLLKSFFESRGSNGTDESQKLCSSIVDAGHMADYLLNTFSFGICHVRWIYEFMKHVEVLTGNVYVMEVNEKMQNMKIDSTTQKEQSHVSVQALRVPSSTDGVVGFEKEMALIRDRLGGHLKQLDVISIIGMPGLGKTTLARKAYEDCSTLDHFDVRAWCSVTQEYNIKDLLLTILGCIRQLNDDTSLKNEADLSVMVHKELKRRRYLIVLDDVWNINAFEYLKRFFPDDCNGSRILLTSRSEQIGLQVKGNSDPIKPHLLTDDESWDLLQHKIYNSKGMCPDELCPFGIEIAKKCKGLPLAVVVVGGVLKGSTQTEEFWEQILGDLNSYLARDSQSQFMASLELSYEYLPNCLRPMFLYFGAFPEDMEIPAKKLMRLWVAEGFVQKTELSSLEDHAERNLMDLIERSLVMVVKRKWDGRVKACIVHDLLRDMCIVKAKEEKFMQQVHVHRELHRGLPHPVMYQHRLSIILENDDDFTSKHLAAYADLPKFSVTPPVYSLLFFDVGHQRYQKGIESVISSLKLLKVFDGEIFQISQDVVDKNLTMLLGLKYVSFQFPTLDSNVTIPRAISRLRSLETLIIENKSGTSTTTVPETIWEMTKLRHLHIKAAKFSAESENSFILENLQTFSTLCIDSQGEKIFGKVPALKKLSCRLQDSQQFQSPDFVSLDELESLNLIFYSDIRWNLISFKLPLTLRKLKIDGSGLSWSQMSILKTLPNLEFLQLSGFDNEEVWDMGDDDVFTNLKFLKLYQLQIEGLSASSSSENLPCLERLVLDECENLEEIPSDLGEIDTLQKIEVLYCNSSLEKRVKEIQKEQEGYGNATLQFYYEMNS